MKKKRKLKINRLLLVLTIFVVIVALGVNLTKAIVKALTPPVVNEVTEIVIHEEPLFYDEVEEEFVVEEEVEQEEQIYIGNFKLTGYCPCSKCCGKWADGYTATMTKATAERTIAVDPDVIPLGSHVIINGHEYIAEDTGSAINENRIDIYCDTHSECFGEHCNGYADVYLLVE